MFCPTVCCAFGRMAGVAKLIGAQRKQIICTTFLR
jgi:hypothetical protein